jgi:anti-sigma B factor antagonist
MQHLGASPSRWWSGDAAANHALKGGERRVPEDRFPALWSGQVAVVRMPAEIDATIADDMREALLSVLNLGARAVVIDMSRTSFCDSAGISALIRAQRRATASDARLCIAAHSDAVLRLFSLIGVSAAIDVYPDVSTALASVPRAAWQVTGSPSSPRDDQARAVEGDDGATAGG